MSRFESSDTLQASVQAFDAQLTAHVRQSVNDHDRYQRLIQNILALAGQFAVRMTELEDTRQAWSEEAVDYVGIQAASIRAWKIGQSGIRIDGGSGLGCLPDEDRLKGSLNQLLVTATEGGGSLAIAKQSASYSHRSYDTTYYQDLDGGLLKPQRYLDPSVVTHGEDYTALALRRFSGWLLEAGKKYTNESLSPSPFRRS